MKKISALLLAVFAGTAVFAEEKVVAFWDFENGVDSGEFIMNKRGRTAIVDDAEQGKVLSPAKERKNKGCGLVLKSDNAASLQVAGPFELSMKLKYTLPETVPAKMEYSYLWDSRYNKKGGMTVILRRNNDNSLMLNVSLGNGGIVSTVLGNMPANFADGKWHELTLRLNDIGKLTMALDGKVFKTGLVPNTPSPAERGLTIGDRPASFYGAFTGLMDDIKLTAL